MVPKKACYPSIGCGDTMAHKTENVYYLTFHRESLSAHGNDAYFSKYLLILIPEKVNTFSDQYFSHTFYIRARS